MPISLDQHRAIIDDIVKYYPFPIAFEFALLDEMVKMGKPAIDICKEWRNVIWFATRYVSIVALSAYLYTDTMDLQVLGPVLDPDDEQIEKDIKTRRGEIYNLMQTALKIAKSGSDVSELQIGPWLDVISRIVEFWQSRKIKPLVPELLNWQNGSDTVAQVAYLYDFYNTPTGITQFEANHINTFEETLKFLRFISFVKEYPLVIVKEFLESQNKWVAYFYFGQSIPGRRTLLEASLLPREVELDAPSLMCMSEGDTRRLLKLLPLAVFSLPGNINSLPIASEPAPFPEHSIAVLDDESQASLRYRLVSLNHSTNPIYVTLNTYVEILNKLLDESLKARIKYHENATWQEIRQFVGLPNGNEKRRNNSGAFKYDSSRYMARAHIDEQLHRFLESDKSLLLLLGDAGVGKTNLMCNWAESFEDARDAIVIFDDCGDFKTNNLHGDDFDEKMYALLGLALPPDRSNLFSSLIQNLINLRLSSPSARVILFLDAINEHPEADKLFEILLDRFCADDIPPWFKVIVTCRTETWERSLRFFALPKYYGALYAASDATFTPLRVFKFTPDETRKAYREFYKLEPAFDRLSSSVQRLLTDPLMLGLTSRVYGAEGVPPILTQRKLLGAYLELLVPRRSPTPDQDWDFLTRLLRLMYEKRTGSLKITELNQDPVLRQYMELGATSPDNPYVKLLAAGLLRETTGAEKQITFRYERVFEYALGEYVVKQKASEHSWNADWFSEQLDDSRTFPNIWGSLYFCLATILEERAFDVQAVEPFAAHPSFQLRNLTIEVLLDFAKQQERNPEVQERNPLVRELAKSLINFDPTVDARKSTHLGETAIAIAKRMGWSEILEIGAGKPVPTLQVASVLAIYYLWRRDKVAGTKLMTRIAQLIMAPKTIGSFLWAIFRARKGAKSTIAPPMGSHLALSFFSLTTMMVTRGWRDPTTIKDLEAAYRPILGPVLRLPGWLQSWLELYFVNAGKDVILAAFGNANTPDVHNFDVVLKLPLDVPRRKLVVRYCDECDPARRDLSAATKGIIELARAKDIFSYYTSQMLRMTRLGGSEHAETILGICQELAQSNDLWQQKVAMDIVGAFLSGFEVPPKPLAEFGREQAARIWTHGIKQVRLAPEDGPPNYLIDGLGYQLLNACLGSIGGQSDSVVDVINEIRSLPWDGAPTDRDIALIKGLTDAATLGYLSFNLNIIPILEGLQLWISEYNPERDPVGEYFGVTASEALAKALATIQNFFPDEVDRYLSLAPAAVRALVASQAEMSVVDLTTMSAGLASGWLFTRDSWRKAWVAGIRDALANGTSGADGVLRLARNVFQFNVLANLPN